MYDSIARQSSTLICCHLPRHDSGPVVEKLYRSPQCWIMSDLVSSLSTQSLNSNVYHQLIFTCLFFVIIHDVYYILLCGNGYIQFYHRIDPPVFSLHTYLNSTQVYSIPVSILLIRVGHVLCLQDGMRSVSLIFLIFVSSKPHPPASPFIFSSVSLK